MKLQAIKAVLALHGIKTLVLGDAIWAKEEWLDTRGRYNRVWSNLTGLSSREIAVWLGY